MLDTLLAFGRHWLTGMQIDVTRYIVFSVGVWLALWVVLAAPLAALTDGSEKPDAPPAGLARDAPVAPTPPVLETFIRQLQ